MEKTKQTNVDGTARPKGSCMKGMVVLIAYTQVNVSARESNVAFDDTQ